MKTLTRALVLFLAYAVGLQPAVAQTQTAAVKAGIVWTGPAVTAGAGIADLRGPQALTLQTPRLDYGVSLLQAAGSISPAVTKTPAVGVTRAVEVGLKIEVTTFAAEEAVRGFSDSPVDDAQAAAGNQFNALTGEQRSQGSTLADLTLVPLPEPPRALRSAFLQRSGAEKPAPAVEVPPAKGGATQVFKDAERNKSFWRYVLGYTVFLFGYEMYLVGMPFLISSITRNSLRERNDPRAAIEETVKELIRQNRTLARFAHWAAQAVSYASIPLFSKKADEGPRTWLVRSLLLRGAVLALVPGLFFATGILGIHAAFGLLLVLFGLQSFFQGITVTMESAAVARIIGDPSVTPAERTKANSILTFVTAAVAIIAPAIAGRIALIRDFCGKTGVGGAVIYGIYAASVAGAGLIYAAIKMITGKSKAAQGSAAEPAPAGVQGTLKHLWGSLKDGLKLVGRSRFLRVFLALALVGSLFSDPLIFNVLPEYVEGILQTSPSLGSLLHIPVLGWFIKGLTGTPMGYFSFLVVLQSIGSIVAATLIKPVRRLLAKLGYHGEESTMLPFYLLAALEAPLFWLMMSWPSMIGVLALYGLQSLATGFAIMTASGLHQKALGTYKGADVNKVLAAESFVGILAAIASTLVYGFLLSGIAIKTSMLIAAIAIGVQGAVRLAAPWLAFTKEQRKRRPGPPPEQLR